ARPALHCPLPIRLGEHAAKRSVAVAGRIPRHGRALRRRRRERVSDRSAAARAGGCARACGGRGAAIAAHSLSSSLTNLGVYRWLVVCREFDRALCAANPRWFPIEGEEATVIGSFLDLRPDDAVAPHYRDPFAVYLMRGAEMWRLACQVLGKADGYN